PRVAPLAARQATPRSALPRAPKTNRSMPPRRRRPGRAPPRGRRAPAPRSLRHAPPAGVSGFRARARTLVGGPRAGAVSPPPATGGPGRRASAGARVPSLLRAGRDREPDKLRRRPPIPPDPCLHDPQVGPSRRKGDGVGEGDDRIGDLRLVEYPPGGV